MLHFLVHVSDPTVTPDPFHVEISRPTSGLQPSSHPSTPKCGSGSGGMGVPSPLGPKHRPRHKGNVSGTAVQVRVGPSSHPASSSYLRTLFKMY